MFSSQRNFLLTTTISFLLLWSTAVTPVSTFCQTTPTDRQTPEQNKIAKDKIRAVVKSIGLILVRNSASEEHLRPRGSGVVVRADGVIVTNYHVIKNDQTGNIYADIFIELNKDEAKALAIRYRLTTIIVNKEQDLALLRIVPDAEQANKVDLTAVEIEPNQVQILDDIVIIGYPEKGGSSVTVNTGVVEGKDLLEEWIKTDARLIRGNSGGAAVNGNGNLIGIPTKIVVDSQQIDKDGDGFPDTVQSYGAVGFLRPAYLVSKMLAQLDKAPVTNNTPPNTQNGEVNNPPQQTAPVVLITVQGVVIKSEDDNRPIAGVRIGLIPPENDEVTPQNLLSWGGSNAEGSFELNKPVPPGKYCLKVKAFGFEPYTKVVEIDEKLEKLVIKLIKSKS